MYLHLASTANATQAVDLNADLSVVKEPVEYGDTPNGEVSTVRIINPFIVVEVLAKSTRTAILIRVKNWLLTRSFPSYSLFCLSIRHSLSLGVFAYGRSR